VCANHAAAAAAAVQVQLELDAADVDYSPGSSSWDVNKPQPFDKVHQLGMLQLKSALNVLKMCADSGTAVKAALMLAHTVRW
jgi:hypothetical protein